MGRLLPLLLLLLSASAHAAGDSRIERAIIYFQEADFLPAKDILLALVEAPELSEEERIRARSYLAASYYELGDEPAARQQLRLLALAHPSARLDPGVFLPELVALAERTRAEVAQESRAVTVAPVPAPAPALTPSVVRTVPPLSAAFVPFGGGQFANGQPLKGAGFLSAQALAFAYFGYNLYQFESRKEPGGVFLRSGTFRDVDEARGFSTHYRVAFGVGLILVAAGVVDAVLSRGAQETPVEEGPPGPRPPLQLRFQE
jgi:hypothetical protein